EEVKAMPSDTVSKSEFPRLNPETALLKVEESDKSSAVIDIQSEQQLTRRRPASTSLRKWMIRAGVLAVLVLIVGFFIWRRSRPTPVTTVQPKLVPITETVASSGRVTGTTETFVGAQAQGVVDKLYVKEGDQVKAGQTLAVLKNDVAEAQV